MSFTRGAGKVKAASISSLTLAAGTSSPSRWLMMRAERSASGKSSRASTSARGAMVSGKKSPCSRPRPWRTAWAKLTCSLLSLIL
ncbi:hypothetical protein D3C77_727430 [compost metagenome]